MCRARHKTNHSSGFATSAVFRSSLVLIYFCGYANWVAVNPQIAEFKLWEENKLFELA